MQNAEFDDLKMAYLLSTTSQSGARRREIHSSLSSIFCIELSRLLPSSSTISSICFGLGCCFLTGWYWYCCCSPKLGASSSLLSYPAILFRLLYISFSSSVIEECLRLLMFFGVPSSATEKNRPPLVGLSPSILPPLLCWTWTDCLRFMTSRY